MTNSLLYPSAISLVFSIVRHHIWAKAWPDCPLRDFAFGIDYWSLTAIVMMPWWEGQYIALDICWIGLQVLDVLWLCFGDHPLAISFAGHHSGGATLFFVWLLAWHEWISAMLFFSVVVYSLFTLHFAYSHCGLRATPPGLPIQVYEVRHPILRL